MLDEEQHRKLKQLQHELAAQTTPTRHKHHRARVLPPDLDALPAFRRRRLANQGTHGSGAALHPPGRVVSVQLVACGHRARVEVLATGQIPARARCGVCGRWRDTIASTARKPHPNASRAITGTRREERDGRTFIVTTFATPKRACG